MVKLKLGQRLICRVGQIILYWVLKIWKVGINGLNSKIMLKNKKNILKNLMFSLSGQEIFKPLTYFLNLKDLKKSMNQIVNWYLLL